MTTISPPNANKGEEWEVSNEFINGHLEEDDKVALPFDAVILLEDFYLETRLETIKNPRYLVKKVTHFFTSRFKRPKKVFGFAIVLNFSDVYLGENFEVRTFGVVKTKKEPRKLPLLCCKSDGHKRIQSVAGKYFI